AEMADDVTRRMARFVKEHPKNALAHYYYAVNLGWARRDPGSTVDRARVETLLKTAIALDPKLPQARFELGVLYAEQQQYTEAISAFRHAIRLDPDMRIGR